MKACFLLFNIFLKFILAHVSWKSPSKLFLNLLALSLVTNKLEPLMNPLELFGLHIFSYYPHSFSIYLGLLLFHPL
jgi:hypothetical protein